MADRERAGAEQKETAAAPKSIEVRVKELENAVRQLTGGGPGDAEQLGSTAAACVVCQVCQVCQVCKVCQVCQVCQVCKVCQVCQVCQVCRVCNVCYECSCGPCSG